MVAEAKLSRELPYVWRPAVCLTAGEVVELINALTPGHALCTALLDALRAANALAEARQEIERDGREKKEGGSPYERRRT